MIQEFRNPSNKYRAKPFWSWNGKLDKDELLRQIHALKDMGFGGYFMHSRVGLATEYLSQEWFDLINACADEGERLGLESWLYDEDRWPSGSAGGMVTQKTENRMKFIRMNTGDFCWSDDVISAFSCDLDGINYYNAKKLDKGEYSDKTIVWFDIFEHPKSAFYNGFTYLDTMKKEAVQDFIDITHKQYKEKCGDRLGKSIKGMFTDEPHRGHVMCKTMGKGYCTPYTDKLFDEFEKSFGYRLEDNLLELFLRKNGEKVSPVKWNYMELTQRLFIDNYLVPIHNWCIENNMQLTGHMLHEDTLSAQAIMQGSLMRTYEHMDVPGVDVLFEHTDNYCIVKQLSSVARQLGKKWLLSELYGCTGWQMNFESHKAVGDWQALLGINLRCHHLSWYTMEGEAKRDYPASILHQSTWYKEYKYVEDYFSRIGVFMSQGNPVCDYLVINPIESMWCQIHANWSVWLRTASEDTIKIDKAFEQLYRWLLSANIDFDYADEEMLSRLYKIDEGMLKVGNAKYKKVIVSGMTTIRKTTVEILKEFQQSGGEVIIIGDAPTYLDAVASSDIIDGSKLEFTKEAVDSLRGDNLVDTDSDDLFVQVRQDEDATYIMILNTNRKEAVESDIVIRADGYFEKWNASDGTSVAVNKPTKVSLPAGGEVLYVITQVENKPEEEKVLPYIELDEPSGYTLDEKNVCVLDFAEAVVNGETWQKDEILKIDRKLRDKYNLEYRGGEMLQPWYVALHTPENLADVKLKFTINSEIQADVELVLEQIERFDITVNGKPIQNIPSGRWIDICFDKVPITIIKGENTIELSTKFREDSNLEAIYLLGDFGVKPDDKTITNLPDKIGYGDLKDYYLPFYTGKITYHFDMEVKEKSKVAFDSLCGCACIKANGKIIGWRPYEAEIEPCNKIDIELVPTRRNLFGPLHESNLYPGGCGPQNFLTEGQAWSDDYCLIPVGLKKLY